MMLPLVLTILASLAFNSNAQERCPPAEAIAPSCICKDVGHGPMLLCSNIMSADELIPPIRATNNIKMSSLVIINSTLIYVPSGVFKYAKYREIEFQKSQLMSLSDTDLAFEGLEDTLKSLRATGANYFTQWDWNQLRNHRKLEQIDINMISMHSLDHEIPPLQSLKIFAINQAKLSFLHPKAFQSLDNLQVIVLKDNELTEFYRSMFPKNAQRIYYIDLSGNHIMSLPDDIFSNMPNLSILNLDDNRIVTLNENIFSWPLQNVQTLSLKGNNILCDCRLRWMVQSKFPAMFEGYCCQPKHMSGVSLKDLNSNNLWC